MSTKVSEYLREIEGDSSDRFACISDDPSEVKGDSERQTPAPIENPEDTARLNSDVEH